MMMRLGLSASILVTLLTTAGPGVGQQPGDVVEVHLRSYEAGWLHRLVLGDLNRDLWDIPVLAPVVDLATYAGGLTPLRKGGGLQTRSLRFQSADGPVYTFRSIDKDATRNLDPQLQSSLAAVVLQDQIGALFPLSAMVVAPLLDAAGVMHPDPELAVMPDSPELGEFREEFAGLIGWIEVRPDEGPDGEPAFAGADRVTGTDALLERIEEEPRHQADAHAFLKARLMDLYVGDWDRHPDQWRWAGFEESGNRTRWYPIPRDRDWALNGIDGVFWGLVRRTIPQYVAFEDEYSSVFGTVWNGRALDRRLLSSLEWADWEVVVEELQAALTDEVIEAAVGALPDSFREAVGADLLRSLRLRRDALPQAARSYYALLAGWVDVFATDEPELVQVTRRDDGSVLLRVTELRRGRVPDDRPYIERQFLPGETRELRLYAQGGADSVVVDGTAAGPIWIRALGGGGGDSYEDRTDGTRVGFYDERGDNQFRGAGNTVIDRSEYEEPEDTESATHQARARDWGRRWVSYPLFGANQDIGVNLGQTLWWNHFGFRRFPQSRRLELSWILNPVNFGFRVAATWRANLSTHGTREWITTLDAGSRDVRYFYDVGNETLALDTEFHRADRTLFAAFSGLEVRSKSGVVRFRAGPRIRHSQPIESEEFRLVQDLTPYGFGSIWQADGVAEFEVDGRDSEIAPRGGVRLVTRLIVTPAILDQSEGAALWTGGASATGSMGSVVATLYAEGATVFGDAPYFDLPSLGGSGSLRGFAQDRFIGHDLALGGAEVRTPLVPFFLLFPGTVGVSAFAETGRVFLSGEASERWRASYGGGLWFSVIDQDYTLSVTLAHSDESTRFYAGLGFAH